MATNDKKIDYVMRTLLGCDDEDIALLKKLRWRSLATIQGQKGIWCFFNLPKNSLGQDIFFLHQYMLVTNVQDEVANMTIEEWQKVDCYLIHSIYLK